MNPIIRVNGISKRYKLGQIQGYKTLRDSLSNLFRPPTKSLPQTSNSLPLDGGGKVGVKSGGGGEDDFIWALKDVSFEVQPGEVVGIIGRNGAGKSTLLKILTRITEPTEGTAELDGRVSSLLEVGTGFHPELTGRENIYLNGAILGMRKAEINKKFDEIVAFSEVEKFIDTPVKRYSSGMYVRLAFAVAAYLEPEILLVDEVLAVGDAAFQEKCLGKMGNIARSGRTILFVSHNLATISALCAKAYLLHQGHILASGPAQIVIEKYLNEIKLLTSISLKERTDRQGNGKLRLTEATIKNKAGNSIDVAMSGQDISIEISYAARESLPLKNVSISIPFYNMLGQLLFFCENGMSGNQFKELSPSGKITCLIPRFPLPPGRYLLNLYCEVNGILADWIQQAVILTVVEGDFFGAGKLPPTSHNGVLVPHSWSCQTLQPS